jgi:cytoskeletal protein CcmA (bactofilin family)
MAPAEGGDVRRDRFRRSRLFWPVLVGVLVVFAAGVAFAQTSQLGGKLRAGGDVVVPEGETVQGDLYASGGSVRVEGTVDGDLVASGGQVHVSGEVTGDLLAGAGSVDVSGQIGGDARVGAGQVTVSGSVGEDLLAGAGQVTLTSSGEVGEDLIFGTGRMTLDGRVEGDVLGSTGNYVRRGTVGGTENVNITKRGEEAEPTVADRILDVFQRFLSVLIVAALLLWLAPRLVDGASDTLRRRPLVSLGIGLVGIVAFVVLVVVIILVAVLVAIGLGLVGLDGLGGTTVFATMVGLVVLGFLFFFVVAFGAHVLVGMSVGRLALGDAGARRWWALVVGVLIVVVMTSLPVVGGWIAFLVAILGLGALLLELNPWRRRGAQTA